MHQHRPTKMTREHLKAILEAQIQSNGTMLTFGTTIFFSHPESQLTLYSTSDITKVSNIDRVAWVESITIYQDTSMLELRIDSRGLRATIRQRDETSYALTAYENVKYAEDTAGTVPIKEIGLKLRAAIAILPQILVLACAIALFRSDLLAWMGPGDFFQLATLALMLILLYSLMIFTLLSNRARRWLYYFIDEPIPILQRPWLTIATIVAPIVATLVSAIL